MHMIIKKRQLVLAGLLVALSLAVFVNWYYTGSKTQIFPEGTAGAEENTVDTAGKAQLVNAEASDSLIEVRLTRTQAQDEALEELREAAAAAPEDSDAYVSVCAAIEALSKVKQSESTIENLVNADVGGECVAVLSDNAVDVVVSRDIFDEESVLKINDIVKGVVGDSVENIRITAAGE